MSPQKRTISLLLRVTEYKYKISHSMWLAGLAQNVFFRPHFQDHPQILTYTEGVNLFLFIDFLPHYCLSGRSLFRLGLSRS